MNSVAVSADGRLALSGSYDGTVKVWDLTSGQELRTLKGHARVVVGDATGGVTCLRLVLP